MISRRNLTRLVAPVLPLLFALPLAAQTVPGTINYQGRLTDNGPSQVPFTGLANLQFAIWDDPAAGTALWIEPAVGATPVTVNAGIFSVLLGGSGVPVPPSIFSGGTVRYLEIVVNGETLTPRQAIASTGYADQSENAALATNATNASNAANSAQLGGIAAAGWQQRVSGTCSGSQAMNMINANGTVGCVSASGGGSINGTTNRVIKFTSATTGGDSLLFDSGTGIGIGTTAPGFPLHVTAAAPITGMFEQTGAANDALFGGNSAAAGSGAGAGVVGSTNQASAFAAGVWGQNSSAGGVGVEGINGAANGTAQGRGVYGLSGQSNGAGVFGSNLNASGTGVIGMGSGTATYNTLISGSGGAFSGTAAGLFGFAQTAASGTGIIAAGNNAPASALAAGSGGAFTGVTTGVYSKNTSSGVSQAIYTDNFGNAVAVNYWNGATQFKIAGTGSVSSNVADPTDGAGTRRINLFAPESPEIYFTDFGQGSLVNGRARIELDPRLAANVTINALHPLRVFIQLEDDENSPGVVVKNKTATGFDVVERGGGKSNAPFQWQIICNRADEALPGGRVSRNADLRFPAVVPGPEAAPVQAEPATLPAPAAGAIRK